MSEENRCDVNQQFSLCFKGERGMERSSKMGMAGHQYGTPVGKKECCGDPSGLD